MILSFIDNAWMDHCTYLTHEGVEFDFSKEKSGFPITIYFHQGGEGEIAIGCTRWLFGELMWGEDLRDGEFSVAWNVEKL
jgi:hypothetical protein